MSGWRSSPNRNPNRTRCMRSEWVHPAELLWGNVLVERGIPLAEDRRMVFGGSLEPRLADPGLASRSGAQLVRRKTSKPPLLIGVRVSIAGVLNLPKSKISIFSALFCVKSGVYPKGSGARSGYPIGEARPEPAGVWLAVYSANIKWRLFEWTPSKSNTWWIP